MVFEVHPALLEVTLVEAHYEDAAAWSREPDRRTQIGTALFFS